MNLELEPVQFFDLAKMLNIAACTRNGKMSFLLETVRRSILPDIVCSWSIGGEGST